MDEVEGGVMVRYGIVIPNSWLIVGLDGLDGVDGLD